VALQAMSRTFSVFPDDDTARTLVILVARMAEVPANTPKHRLRRVRSTPRIKESMAQVKILLDIIRQQKAQAVLMSGLSLDELDDAERKQIRLEILTELLMQVMQRILPEDVDREAQVRDQLIAVAEEMNLRQVGLDSNTIPANVVSDELG
jgi:hypothetical protein